MKAPVALTLKVIGNRSAMVSAGPIPGSTPTAVPRKQPSSAQPRLASVSAPAKPDASPSIGDIVLLERARAGAPPWGDGSAEAGRAALGRAGAAAAPQAERRRAK